MRNTFKTLYLDIHILQMLPPSNPNRGEMGEPKTAVIGGTTRSRISSQAQKRAARLYMYEHGVDKGVRTRHTLKCLEDHLISAGMDPEEAKEASIDAAKSAKIITDKEGKKEVLSFMSKAQYEAITSVVTGKETMSKKDYESSLRKAIMDNPTVDMLLFGRMFASSPSLNYDAACQVMNAFSVNQVRYEFDYFTAVEDLKDKYEKEDAGAAHLDTKIFTDPVLYRYANVNLSETSELLRLGHDQAAKAACAFAEAFIRSMPSGSSNTYANVTLPSYVMLCLRDDQPVNFAPAFTRAVSEPDYLKEAKERLEGESERISKNFGSPVFACVLLDQSLKEVLDGLRSKIQESI